MQVVDYHSASYCVFNELHLAYFKTVFIVYRCRYRLSFILTLTSFSYDIVLDATDNVATRYLLNDACVLAAKPLVSGSALRFEGQVSNAVEDWGV